MKYPLSRSLSYMFAFILGGYTMAYTRFEYKISIWDWVISIVFFVVFVLAAESKDKK